MQKIQAHRVEETFRNSQGILEHIGPGHSESSFTKEAKMMEEDMYGTIPTAKNTARVS